MTSLGHPVDGNNEIEDPEVLRSEAGPSRRVESNDAFDTDDEDFMAVVNGAKTSTPERNVRPGDNIWYPSPLMNSVLRESHSFMLSPDERQRQRDMSFGLRLPIENLEEENAPTDDDVTDEKENSNEETDEEENVEPPSPVMLRGNTDHLRTTPLRRLRKSTDGVLTTVFNTSHRDLTGAKVQLMSWEGSGKDEVLKLKISDGQNWINATIKSSYKIYFFGRMFHDLDIFQILEYTGMVNQNNIHLEKIERPQKFQVDGQKIGNPVPLSNHSLHVTEHRGIKRLYSGTPLSSVCTTPTPQRSHPPSIAPSSPPKTTNNCMRGTPGTSSAPSISPSQLPASSGLSSGSCMRGRGRTPATRSLTDMLEYR